MIITLLNDTFTWYGIRWDVHTVAESTTCTVRILKAHAQESRWIGYLQSFLAQDSLRLLC